MKKNKKRCYNNAYSEAAVLLSEDKKSSNKKIKKFFWKVQKTVLQFNSWKQADGCLAQLVERRPYKA